MKTRLRAPSPAFVISLVALFVALGGTTYAAVALPAHSVGTKQLKNGAVTKKKIATKTIASLRGNPGPAGPQGAKGDTGNTGLRGPSDAYNKTASYSLNNLPAGSYAIIAKIAYRGGTGLASISCDLLGRPSAGGSFTKLDHAQTSSSTSSGTTDLVLPLQALATFSATQNLFIGCSFSASGGSPILTDDKLIAIQVGAIH
jgi:hypothetical protein